MQCLVDFVPYIRFTLIRFYAELTSNAKLQRQIIPGRPARVSDDLGGASPLSTAAHMS